jgi:hypothetical protein
MKLFIPTIGTRLKLTANWNFALFRNSRNKSLFSVLPEEISNEWNKNLYSRRGDPQVITVPVGTVLTVDRIYIRQRKGDYDSITFKISKGDSPDVRFQKTRFWVKLEDCNNMDCEIEHQVGFSMQNVL